MWSCEGCRPLEATGVAAAMAVMSEAAEDGEVTSEATGVTDPDAGLSALLTRELLRLKHPTLQK